MNYQEINTIDSKIHRLSEMFQKALVNPSGATTLLAIKRELQYWREQRKTLTSGNTCRMTDWVI